jgi:LuxR family glucitol operon transcriptional activator
LVERALISKRTLLIVDNLETVDEEEVLTFLHELPDPTKAIVTTRHRIDIAYGIRLTGMPRTDALAFIALETTHKRINLETTAVEDLYRRTGGIPLAIVWSIALMGLGYSSESVLRRLGSGHSDIARFCFQESISSIRDRNAYHLLTALAFFEASVNRKMLGEVAGLGDDEIGRDDALAELLQLSLVNQERDRFTLLPLTRSFVLDTLKQESELEQLLREQWVKHLTDFVRPYTDLYWLQYELRQILQEGMHLVTLVSWCQSVGRLDVVLKVFPALAIYYDHMGQWTDLLTIGQMALENAQLTGDSEILVFVETHAMSFVLSQQGRYAEAEQHISHALEVARHLGDVSWQCEVLVDYSRIMRRCKRFDEAVDRCQQALELVTPPNNRRQIYLKHYVKYELGKIARDRGDWHTAQVHFLAARDVFRHDQSDPVFNRELAWGILGNLGFVAHQLGDLAGAEQMYLQALPRYRELGSRSNIPVLLVRLATLEEQRGNREAALKYADEALDWSQKLGMVREQALAEAVSARLSKGES